MKFLSLFFIIISSSLLAQTEQDIFVQSGNLYLESKTDLALQKVTKGIELFPSSIKLQKLKQTIEEERDQDQEKEGETNEGDQSEDENQDSQDESKDQQNSSQQDGDNKGEKGTGSSDKNPKDARGQNNQNESRKNRDFESMRQDRLLRSLKEQEQNTQRRLMIGQSKQKMYRNKKDW